MPIRLVPFSDDHLAGMRELVADPDSVRFTRIPEPPPHDFAEEWLERYRPGQPDPTRAGFAIVDDDDTFLGVALAPSIDHPGRQVELGYLVAPWARGRGVAAEALRQLTSWAFDELGALRAYLIINATNGASRRVAERAGYQREGLMRSLYLKQDQREDCELWSRLPSDPPPDGG
ncbi:MAG TPA: GNAT family N-acetyltransferase [Capillimicrobium sp.]